MGLEGSEKLQGSRRSVNGKARIGDEGTDTLRTAPERDKEGLPGREWDAQTAKEQGKPGRPTCCRDHLAQTQPAVMKIGSLDPLAQVEAMALPAGFTPSSP